jgi:hypothetical protein
MRRPLQSFAQGFRGSQDIIQPSELRANTGLPAFVEIPLTLLDTALVEVIVMEKRSDARRSLRKAGRAPTCIPGGFHFDTHIYIYIYLCGHGSIEPQ